MGQPKRRDFTVGDINRQHVLKAMCSKCSHEQVMPHGIFKRWPEHLLMAFLERKLKCSKCGNKGSNYLSIE